MRHILMGFLLALSLSATGALALGEGDLPDETAWYLHVDLLQMQSTVTGQYLMDWANEEIFDEVAEETGVDLRGELDGITLFGRDRDSDAAIVLHGSLRSGTKETIMDLLRTEADAVEESGYGNLEVYSVNDLDFHDHDSRVSIDSDDGAFIAFGKTQTLLTPSSKLLQEWVDAGGRIQRSNPSHAGALIVLQADRSLIKGGVGHGIGRHGPWNSSIGKNMQQVAMILFDEAGIAALDVNIVTTGPETAETLHNVVKGLIALKSLAADEEPELAALLDETDVDLVGDAVTIKTRIDPNALSDFLK